MAADGLDIRLRLLGAAEAARQARDVNKQIGGMGHSAKKASEESKGAFGFIGDSLKQAAGYVGVIGGAELVKSMVTGGMQLQQQQSQLQAALKSTGETGTDAYNRMSDAAEKLSTRGGFSTEQNIQSLTAFQRETHNSTQSLNMLNLATNIARGRGLDLATSQNVVARAYTGQVGRLQQLLGPMIAAKDAQFGLTQAHQQEILALENQSKAMGKAGPEWLKQQEALHQITPQMQALATLQDRHATGQQIMAAAQTAFGGATGAYDKTSAGRLNDLRNSVNNLKNDLGEKLLPVVNTLVKFATHLVNVFGKLGTPLQVAIVGFIALGPLLVPLIASFRSLRSLGSGVTSAFRRLKGTTDEAKSSEAKARDNLITLADAAKAASGGLAKCAEACALGGGGGLGGGKLGGEAKAAEEEAGKGGGFLARTLGKIPGLGKAGELLTKIPGIGKLAAGIGSKGLLDALSGPVGWGAMGVATLLNHTGLGKMVQHIPVVGGALHSISNFVGFARGGMVPRYFASGGPSGTDTVPAYLTPGETVLDRSVTAQLGGGNIEAMVAAMHAGAGNRAPIEVRVVGENFRFTDQAGRIIGQMVLRQAQSQAARGAGALMGGALATTGGYTVANTGAPV